MNLHCHICGAKFRNMAQEAKHRHNFPAFCKPPKPPRKYRPKDCFCVTCAMEMNSLGVARHRAMHRDKKQNCIIEYGDGRTISHNFSVDNHRNDMR